MEEVKQIINKIKNGHCDEKEILKYLDIHSLFILSNAMFEIVRKRFNSSMILKKLQYLSRFRDPEEHKLFGIDTIGLLAIATLIKIGVKKEDIEVYNELDQLLKNRVDILVEQAFDD